MAKHESTAINELIHVTQGRLPELGGPDPADGLFVTKPPRPATFVPVAAYFDPCALTTPVPLAPLPPPLPRRRAPNATPPVQPVFHEDEDDDEETQIDENVMARFAAGSSPSPLPFASPLMPQPILPHYAIPSPVPLPPAPQVAGYAATERVARVTFTPSPAVGSQYPVSAPRMSSRAAPAVPYPAYVPAERPSIDVLDTHRVDPLPAPALGDPRTRGELVSLAKKLALPFAAVAVGMVFVVGYVIHSGQGGRHHGASPSPAPVVMAVTPPPSAAVAAAAQPVAVAKAAPIVTAIVDAAPPTVSATGDAIGWKPRDVQPTIVAKSEAPAAAPVVAVAAPAADEIEMDAVAVVKPPRARRSSSSSRTVAKQVAVALPAPKPVKAVKPAKASKVAKAAPAGDDDPISAAINAPTKSRSGAGKGSGPGTLTITSTPAALIYVDGRSLNKMTPQTLTLSEGSHKITLLELKSRKAKTSEVEVEAGGSSQIAKKF